MAHCNGGYEETDEGDQNQTYKGTKSSYLSAKCANSEFCAKIVKEQNVCGLAIPIFTKVIFTDEEVW